MINGQQYVNTGRYRACACAYHHMEKQALLLMDLKPKNCITLRRLAFFNPYFYPWLSYNARKAAEADCDVLDFGLGIPLLLPCLLVRIACEAVAELVQCIFSYLTG